ncbi:MAG: sodium/proline symporter PutP [Actinomycetota bacterium]
MPVSFPILTTFGIYLLGMLGIGVWVYRRNKNLTDFVLGGRTLNSWVAALSAQASDMSGWLLLGLPGAAYAGGLGAGWIAVGLAIGTYLNWRLVAGRLRIYTEQAGALQREGGSITISSYFENRFEDRSHLLRMVSAVVIIVFFSIYVASGLVAGGILFNEVFGIEPTLAITVAVLVIVSYTFLGGFLAVSFTDFVQGSLMWVALMVVPVILILSIGGFNPLINGLEAQSPALLSIRGNVGIEDGGWIASESLGVVLIVSGLAWGLGYFGQPHILARFMGIRSAAQVPRARRIAMVWVITTLVGAMIVGLVGIVFFEEQLSNPETVFISAVQEVFNPWIAGLMLAAVLAAIMSTADSQLLVVSSALTEDFYRALLNRDASDTVLLWVGRITVVAVAIVAYVLALGGGTVLNLVAYAWAGFGAAFGPLIITSLFWRRMNRLGALAGMIGGAVTVVLWRQLDPFGWGLYEIVPGVAVAFVLIFIFSLLGPEPSERIESDFDVVSERSGRQT